MMTIHTIDTPESPASFSHSSVGQGDDTVGQGDATVGHDEEDHFIGERIDSIAHKDHSTHRPTTSSIRPDVSPGPGDSPSSHLGSPTLTGEAFISGDLTQPGPRPDVLTPALRSDMYHHRYLAALSYVPLGFLLAFSLRGSSRFTIYHARQGLAVFIVQFLCSFFTAIPFLGVFVFGLALFLSIIGIVSALRAQEYYQFPLLGALSEKLTFL